MLVSIQDDLYEILRLCVCVCVCGVYYQEFTNVTFCCCVFFLNR